MGSAKQTHTAENVSQRIWLQHFNDTLLEKGMITAIEHRNVRLKIVQEYPDNKYKRQ